MQLVKKPRSINTVSYCIICSSGPVLQGHSLPHAVPIQALFRKHVTEAEAREQADSVADLLEDTNRHLRGFLSRQQQCRDLQQK